MINKPFLVIGYQRSGTTMLRRLVSMHPGMSKGITHEGFGRLRSCKTAQEAYKTFRTPISDIEHGWKMPYTGKKNAKAIIDKYIELFGDKGSVIHIVRRPIPTINSQVVTFNANPALCIRDYSKSIPFVAEYIKKFSNVIQMSFHDIVAKPRKMVQWMYWWMGEAVDDSIVTKIISTKDEWHLNGKYMYGLKYANKVGRKHPSVIKKVRGLLSDIHNMEKLLPKKLFKSKIIK